MNNILNTSFDTLYLFAGMVFIEYIISLILLARRNLSLIRVFLAALTGNAISTIMCLLLPGGEGEELGYFTCLGIAFAVAVVVEWFIYIAYFRTEEFTVSNTRFFFCSLFGNIISFAGIFCLQHFEILD